MLRFAPKLLLALLFAVVSCSDSGAGSTEAQRSVTEYTLPDGSELVALPGAIRAADGDVIARFVAPQGRLELTTTPLATGEKSFVLDNLAPDGSVTLSLAQVVTDDEVEGCGSASATILCATATAAVGAACPAEGCPTGTLCESGACRSTRALDRCSAAVETVPDIPTRRRLTFTPQPCTRSIFEVSPPSSDNVTFVVAGVGDYATILQAIREEAEAGEIDFVVFLGDNLSGSESDQVDQLTTIALNYPVPLIALPGEIENRVSDSPTFVGRFGPGDFSFRYGPLRAFSFTSANRQLGSRGLDRIRSLIRQLESRDAMGEDFPLVGFTHTPPIDPNGGRDLGFINEIEGARTMSLLTENGVDALFAGHVRAPDFTSIGDLELILTSTEGGLLDDRLEILRVRVGPSGTVDGRVVGSWAYDVQRVGL